MSSAYRTLNDQQEKGMAQPINGKGYNNKNYNGHSNYHQKLETQRSTGTGFRDPFFLVLFLGHFVAIVSVAFSLGLPAFQDSTSDVDTPDNTIDSSVAKKMGLACVGLASLTLVFSAFLLNYIIRNAESMIRTVLNLNVAVSIIFAILAFVYNQVVMGIILTLVAMINVCYLRAVQRRIPFASANLKVASAAIRANFSVIGISYLVVIKSIMWSAVWSLATYGVYNYGQNETTTTTNDDGTTDSTISDSTGMTMFLLMLSFYWTHELLRNLSHVTTSGVVASFWYDPDRQNVVSGAYCRSCTTSLGSIAFGSLIVAFLQTLKAMAESAERKGNSAACLARCILQCFENMMRYFNRWAFVYVGIYGDSFIQSGKAVMELFKDRGLTTIVNDNLIQSTLSFCALMMGCVMAGVGACIPSLSGNAFDSIDSAVWILAVMGFMLGIFMTMIMMSVIDSGVATVFVCFAESANVLEQTHPALYYELTAAWKEAHNYSW